jgi:lipopolysaccharide export system permease protein
MKILTKYILKEFITPFVLAMVFFATIILVVRVFEDIRFIMDHKPPFLVTTKYFLLQIPFLLLQVTPVAVLMAVLFSLGHLAKGSELIAMRAGGVSILLVTWPLVAMGFLVFLFSLVFNETVVPKANQKKERIKYVEIEKKPVPQMMVKHNLSIRGAYNRMYHIVMYDGNAKTMEGVLLLEFDQGVRLKSRLDAKSASWRDGNWVFQDGYYRTFDETGLELSAQPFTEMPLELPEKPGDFTREEKEPRDLNMMELLDYIRQLKLAGADYQKEMVELHLKVAFPFACVVLVLLGVPTGWNLGKYSGVAAAFGICLVVAFFYLGLIQVGHALGSSGVLSPFVAVWIANLIFGGLGAWMLVKRNR